SPWLPVSPKHNPTRMWRSGIEFGRADVTPRRRSCDNASLFRHAPVTRIPHTGSGSMSRSWWGETMHDVRTRSPMHPSLRLSPAETWRPERCDRVALVLQGGGALGAYQAGVYQAMHEAGVEPDWVSGVSIGAINSAIIAGNPPNQRL